MKKKPNQNKSTPKKTPEKPNLLGIQQSDGTIRFSTVLKKIWIDALLSGKYRQGKGKLCSIDKYRHRRYCPLGVLCKVLQENMEGITTSTQILPVDGKLTKVLQFEFGSFPSCLDVPENLAKMIGLSRRMQEAIALRNDGKRVSISSTETPSLSFKEIADFIQNSDLYVIPTKSFFAPPYPYINYSSCYC